MVLQTFAKTVPRTLSNGITYHFTLILKDNRITFYVDNQLIFDERDDDFSSSHGKFGLKAGTGTVFPTKVRFDNIVVTELDSTSSLDVPFFSQNDPAWGQDEYDSASQYEWGKYDDTIDGWGCYITSAAMLLRFHGHTTLPDGSVLNPKTLNEWLLSFEHKQDGKGYQGGGLNPLAITRLTQLNSELNNNLPKLEYLKVNKDDQLLESKLKENQPVILYVPTKKGHFVVARGLQDDTFILNDPEATQEGTLLTEYGDYLSMRTFTPSNTDLSYFLFFPSSPNLELTLKNQNGEVVPLEIIMDDAIAHQTIPGLQQPEMKVWGIPKPETGAYTLEVTSPSPGPFTVETHLYNNKAESNITETTGFVGDEPKILNIDFDKEESGQVVEEVGFEQFIQDLDLMWELKHFKKYPIYRAIRLEANIAERANKKITKLALAKTIQRSIQLMKPSTLSTEGKEYLLHRIDLLIENLKSN